MSLSQTLVANMSLAKLGSKRINNIETDQSAEAIQCRTHYEQTWNSLLRSFEWPFASARAALVEDTNAPTFEWDHQFFLPEDFLRMKRPYDISNFTIEGKLLLTDDDAVEIRYIRKVTDPNKADPLFIKVFVLELALELLAPLAGTNATALEKALLVKLKETMSRARAVCAVETRQAEQHPWNNARFNVSTTAIGKVDATPSPF